jgi:hypothetical protein
MAAYVLAIDQGTTSSRAIVFDGQYRIRGLAQLEFAQHFPKSGWVEHDPKDLWTTTVETVRGALADAGLNARDIAAIGITNQRETTVVWDRKTGEPVYNAIVWQDRRTSEFCAAKKADGLEPMVTEKTGLLLDPYFSGTKIAWILDHVDGARARAEAANLHSAPSTAGSSGISPAGKAPCHRCDQRLAHAALQYRHRPMGRRLAVDAQCAGQHAARSQGLGGRVRHGGSASVRCGASYPRRRRRSAGRNRRSGLFQARHAEINLWHRLLRAAQHRHRSGGVNQPAANHHRLSARWPSRPTLWKARSSWPAPLCNGCATHLAW